MSPLTWRQADFTTGQASHSEQHRLTIGGSLSTSSLHPHGVFSAALTPLDAELAPDHARFVAHCRYLLD